MDLEALRRKAEAADDGAMLELIESLEQACRDVIDIAEVGGMPDSYKQTDSRMLRAYKVLGIEP